jgi:hypothetical protein
MSFPFLDDKQVEELERFGYVEWTEELQERFKEHYKIVEEEE